MKRKLLVVDEQDDVLSAVGARMRGRGWQVFYASSAEEGIVAAARETPSVILLDADMRGESGLRAFGEFLRLSQAPVLLSTARRDELSRGKLTDGAKAVLAKPLDLDALETLLASALSA